jgi:tetratricopeptide (TPR) repeat protein
MKVFLVRKFFLLIVFLPGLFFAQKKYQRRADSLQNILKTNLSDTSRIRILNLLGDLLASNRDKEAPGKIDEALALSASKNNFKGTISARINRGNYLYSLKNLEGAEKEFSQVITAIDSAHVDLPSEKGRAFYYLGRVYYDRGESNRALGFFEKARALYEKVKNEKGLGSVFNMAGLCYWSTDRLDKALDYFIKASDIKRKANDKAGLANAFGNIGLVYSDLRLFDQSIKFHREAVRINREIDAGEGLFNELNNLGITYYNKKVLDSAELYIREALELAVTDSNEAAQARCYNNLGLVYDEKGTLAVALNFYEKSLAIKEKLGGAIGLASAHINIGAIQGKRNNFEEAEKHFKTALEFGIKAESLERQKEAYLGLYENYYKRGKYQPALEAFINYSKSKDSIFNEGNNKIIAEMNERFESDQKDRLLEKKTEENALEKLRADKEHSSKIYSYALSLLAVIISAGAIIAFVQIRKGNKLLAEKNAAIEAQKQEITDSINYAKRIQQAILPAAAEMKVLLPPHAIFYRPKDIVAGDFYWFTLTGRLKNGNQQEETILLAAADCTGHGVPGAFMSLIGKENLDKAVQRVNSPGALLSHLNKGLKAALQQSVSSDAMQDGMDISVIALEANARLKNAGDTTRIKFSGANRPVWILNGSGAEASFKEIKGTKAAIGGYTADKQEFEETEITIEKNDSVYLFTDGYPDQFGGDKEKKLTTKRFRNFLLKICHLSPDEQVEKLDAYFSEWKKNCQQVDDVLVIVLKF